VIRNVGRGQTDRARAAFELAIRYLARKDRTEAQVRAHLGRRRVPAAATAGVIRQLRTQGLLDDERYARRWAVQRLARRPMGRERLEAELAAQGLSRRIVAAAADAAYEGISEDDLARRALSRPGRGPAWLRRHGFTEETIEAVAGGELRAYRSGALRDRLNPS
jgi:regulatory protein